MKSRKNKILSVILGFNVVVYLLAACCLDSEAYYIPLGIMGVSGFVLLLFFIANIIYKGGSEDF